MKPVTPSQISYLKHLLEQVGADEPDWDKLSVVDAGALIADLKAKRGRPVWYGNGQFSHWEKKAADVEIPAEWFEEKKRALSDWLATPVKGSDFNGVASKIEEFSAWLVGVVQEAVGFSRYNPYFAKEIERLWKFWDADQKLRWCATRYRSAVPALKSDTAFGAFASKAILDNYDRTVKSLASAIENEPEISWRPLHTLESRLRYNAPQAIMDAWGTLPPTPEFLSYLKENKAREKVLANALEKRQSVNALNILDRFFRELGKSKYLDPQLYEDKGVAREISIGKAKVVILDPSGELETDKWVISTFRKAYGLLQRAGLDNVWYGPLLFLSKEAREVTDEEWAAMKEVGYAVSRKFGGVYNPGTDSVEITGYEPEHLLHTIVHELGHRYWFRFLQPTQRAWFNDMVQTRDPADDVDRAKVRDVMDYVPGRKTEDGLDKPVTPVSEYGGVHIFESFAEVFADYVMRRKLNRDQLESFKQMLRTSSMQGSGEEALWEPVSAQARAVVLSSVQGWVHARMTTRVAARYKSKKKIKTKDGDERTIYEYSERQIALRNAEKARKVEKLKTSIGKLRAKVRKDLRSEDPEKKLTALAVALMDETYERVGNDTSAEERGHFGVTGWQRGHLSFGKGGVTISYTGKSGVKHKKKVSDSAVKNALRDAYEAVEGEEASLFEWEGGRVTAEKVNAYLEPFGVTAKDVRGFHANRVMSEKLKEARKKGGGLPEAKKDRNKVLKAEFKEALEATAEEVGHEAATLKNQYLVSGLEEQYLKDGSILDKVAGSASTDMAAQVVTRYLLGV